MDIEDANKSIQPTPWDVACFFLEGRRPAADFHRYLPYEQERRSRHEISHGTGGCP